MQCMKMSKARRDLERAVEVAAGAVEEVAVGVGGVVVGAPGVDDVGGSWRIQLRSGEPLAPLIDACQILAPRLCMFLRLFC